MKEVRYTPHNGLYDRNLTIGKKYKVHKHFIDDDIEYIYILNDRNYKDFYKLYRRGIKQFEDITHELRNNIINDILS